jgi:hypothetical protein
MVTSQEVKLRVEQYFGDTWVWHVLKGGCNWGVMRGAQGYSEYWDVMIDSKEIRIYPVKTNRELAIRLAIWDYAFVGNPGRNQDDMYIRTEEDLGDIPILLDKFFG